MALGSTAIRAISKTMSGLLQDVRTKLNEASLFLNLMRHTEATRTPLLAGYGVDAQFSYLLSAYLSACYSVTAFMKEDGEHKQAVEHFRKQHPDFYASHRDGGWRTQSIHFTPVIPKHDGYIPPPENQVNFYFGRKPYATPKGDAVNFDFSESDVYYFTKDSPQNSICEICATHLSDLRGFVETRFSTDDAVWQSP